MIHRSYLWLFPMAVWIEGCTSVELPQTQTSLRELYQQATTARADTVVTRPLSASMLPARSHDLERPLQRDFAVLPNPRLLLYVHPHFSASGDPVPGYATWFTVFERALLLEPQP